MKTYIVIIISFILINNKNYCQNEKFNDFSLKANFINEIRTNETKVSEYLYPMEPQITRIEGNGNGGNILEFTNETLTNLMSASPYMSKNPVYEPGKGPIKIKITNNYNFTRADFKLKFVVLNDKIDSARWELTNLDNGKQYYSQNTIQIENEQFISELGISVTIGQVKAPGDKLSINNGYLNPNSVGLQEMEYTDKGKQWLGGVIDEEGLSLQNWILSGTYINIDYPEFNDYNYTGPSTGTGLDNNENFEKILNRMWAPYKLSSSNLYGPVWNNQALKAYCKLSDLASVDLVITPDKTKWTRSVVVETCEDPILSIGNVKKFDMKTGFSLDKDGKPDGTGIGMSWFPGYAINLETGERLNIIFGEDSWLVGENGADMKFNPTSELYTKFGDVLWGGKHFVYIMGHNGDGAQDCPAYDEGKWIYEKLINGSVVNKIYVYRSAMWVGIPLAIKDKEWLSNQVKLRFRVSQPYKRYYSTASNASSDPKNSNFPLYTFSTKKIYYNINKIKNLSINIFPNPVSKTLFIRLGNPFSNGIISIFDSYSKIVFIKHFDYNSKEILVDLSSYRKGIYFIKIESENNLITKKIIVN